MRKDNGKSRHSGDRSEKQLERMKAKLALSERQVAQLTAINTDFAAKMKAAKEASTDKGAHRSAFRTLRSEKMAAIKAILNEEQLAKFKAMKLKRKGRRGERRDRGKHAGTPEERAQIQTERLTEKLSLTADQATKVAALNLEYATKIKAAKDAASDKETGKAAVKTLREEKAATLKGILDTEQVAKYEAMKRERKDRRRERGAPGRHSETPEERAQKRTERLTKKLSLTEEQVTKVAAINLANAEKMNAAKEAAPDKEARREAMKAIRSEQHSAIKAVLTPEQVAAYDAMKDERRGRGGKGRGWRK